MKNRKNIKLIYIFLLIIFFITILQLDVFGEGNFDISYDSTEELPGKINNLTNNVLTTAISVMRIVGIGIAIIIITVIAMKYMIAAPGDRADIKKNAIPFVIGAFVLFGASGIIGIIGGVASKIQAK